MNNTSSISLPDHILYNNKYYGFELFTPKLHQNSSTPQFQLVACILQSLNSSHYQWTLGVEFLKFFMQYQLEDSFLDYTNADNTDSQLQIWAAAACYRLLRLKLLFINSNNEIQNVLPESFFADETIHPLFVRLNEDNSSFSSLLLKRTWTLTREEHSCPELDFRRITEEKEPVIRDVRNLLPPVSQSPGRRIRSADAAVDIHSPPPPQSPLVRASSAALPSPPSTPPKPTVSSKTIPVSPSPPVDDQVPSSNDIVIGAAMVDIESPPVQKFRSPVSSRPKTLNTDTVKKLSDHPVFKEYIDSICPPSPPQQTDIKRTSKPIPKLDRIKGLRNRRIFKAATDDEDEKNTNAVAAPESPQVSFPSSQTYIQSTDLLSDAPKPTSPIETEEPAAVEIKPSSNTDLEVSKTTAEPPQTSQLFLTSLQTDIRSTGLSPIITGYSSPVEETQNPSVPPCDTTTVKNASHSNEASHMSKSESDNPKSEENAMNIATVSKSEEEAKSTPSKKKKRVALVSCTDTNVRFKKLKEYEFEPNADDDNKKANQMEEQEDEVPLANLIIKKTSDCSRCRELVKPCSRTSICTDCEQAGKGDVCVYDDPTGELFQQAIANKEEQEQDDEKKEQNVSLKKPRTSGKAAVKEDKRCCRCKLMWYDDCSFDKPKCSNCMEFKEFDMPCVYAADVGSRGKAMELYRTLKKKNEAEEKNKNKNNNDNVTTDQEMKIEEPKLEPMQVDDSTTQEVKQQEQQAPVAPSSILNFSPLKPITHNERQESQEAREYKAHIQAQSQEQEDEPAAPLVGLVSRSASSVFHSPFTLRGFSSTLSYCELEPFSLSQSSVNNNHNNHRINLNINSSRSVSLEENDAAAVDPFDNHSLVDDMHYSSLPVNTNNNSQPGIDNYPISSSSVINTDFNLKKNPFAVQYTTPETIKTDVLELTTDGTELLNRKEALNVMYGQGEVGQFPIKFIGALKRALIREELSEGQIIPFITAILNQEYMYIFRTLYVPDITGKIVDAHVLYTEYPGPKENKEMENKWKSLVKDIPRIETVFPNLQPWHIMFPVDHSARMRNFLFNCRSNWSDQTSMENFMKTMHLATPQLFAPWCNTFF